MYSEQLQLDRLKIRIGIKDDKKDDLLLSLLNAAQWTINNIRRYTPTIDRPVEPQYEYLEILMAAADYNKLGAEGQSGHSEGGINIQYKTDDNYPIALIRRIVPVIR